jgi:hypothetical protein
MALTKKDRIFTALALSVPLIVIYALIALFGFMMGAMGTDACHGVEEYAVVYLFFIWPALLLLAALVPGTLLIFKLRARLVALGGALAGFFALLSFLIYPLLLQSACHHIK